MSKLHITKETTLEAAVDAAMLKAPNAEAHGRAVARTVQPLVGHSES